MTPENEGVATVVSWVSYLVNPPNGLGTFTSVCRLTVITPVTASVTEVVAVALVYQVPPKLTCVYTIFTFESRLMKSALALVREAHPRREANKRVFITG